MADDAVVRIGGDVSGILDAMKQLNASFAQTATQISQFAARANPALENLPTTLRAGATAGSFFGIQLGKAFDIVLKSAGDMVKALPAVVQQTANFADGLRDMSLQTGVSVEALSQFRFVASQTGTSLGAITTSIQALSRRLGDGSQAVEDSLRGLGLSVRELQALDPAEQFVTVFEAIGRLPTEAEKAAVGFKLFGGRFRQMSQLATEDIRALMRQADELGLTLSTKTANQADKFNDAMDVMAKMVEATKMQIGAALLPALTSIAEQAPKAGGAVLLIGQNLAGLGSLAIQVAANMVPLGTALGMVQKWAFTLGNTVPILTARVWLLDAAQKAAALSSAAMNTRLGALAVTVGTALKGALIAIAPLIAAAGAAFVGWKIGEAARHVEVLGVKLRDLQDVFTRGGAKWLKWLGIVGDFSDADLELSIAAQNAAEDLERQGQATETSAGAAAQAVSGYDQLRARMEAVRAEVASLTAAQRKQITELLNQDVAVKDIADAFNVSAEAITLFKKQIDDANEAMKASPLGKFREDLKGFATDVRTAIAANAPMKVLIEEFGKSSSDLVSRASRIPGALAEIPPEVANIANAWAEAELAKVMEEIHKKSRELHDHWQKELREAALKTAQAINENLLGALQNAVQIEGDLAIARKTGIDRQLAQIERAEQAELASAELRFHHSDQLRVREMAAIRAKYDEQRLVVQRFTGDVLRDAEMRGIKTREQLETELATEQRVLAEMLEHRELFTDAAIRQQEEIVEGAERAAKGEMFAWREALGAMAQAWGQLGSVAGGTLGAIAEGIGTAITGVNTMATSIQGAMKGFGAGGFAGILTGIGGLVSAAGAAISIGKKLGDALFTSEGEKVVKEAARDWGVKITEEMGDAIAKTAKEKFSGDRWAAEIFHIGDFIEAAGGINDLNFDKFTRKLRDVFSMVEMGKFSADEAREVLDENFGTFAEHVLKSGKIASAGFQEILKLNQESGVQSQEVIRFVEDQTKRLGGALGQLMSPFTKNVSEIKRLKDEIAKTTDQAKLADLNKQLAETQGKLGDAGTQMARFERLAVAGFNAAIKNGVSYLDAIDQLSPALDQIVDAHKALGTEAGPAIAELLKFRDITKQNPELVQSAAALNEVALALSNVGGLNAETLADLAAQGQDTFQQLTAAGFSEGQALQQMKGFLESVRDAHAQLGIPIDANTQKLIDQATQQGILAAEGMDTNNILMDGLGALIETLGGKLPEAWQKMKDAASQSASETQAAVTDQIGGALDGVTDRMKQVPFGEFAGKAVAAGGLAKGAIEGTAGAVGHLEGELAGGDWSGWADEIAQAASDAQAAVDAVSFGESPGGIKEIPIQLRKATEAARQFADQIAAEMASAKSAVDIVGAAGTLPTLAPPIAGLTRAATEGLVAAAQPQAVGDTIALTFEVKAFDSADVTKAVEDKILPATLETLKRGRSISTLKELLR